MRVSPQREMLEYLDSIGVKPPLSKSETPSTKGEELIPVSKQRRANVGCLPIFLVAGIIALTPVLVRVLVLILFLCLSLSSLENTSAQGVYLGPQNRSENPPAQVNGDQDFTLSHSPYSNRALPWAGRQYGQDSSMGRFPYQSYPVLPYRSRTRSSFEPWQLSETPYRQFPDISPDISSVNQDPLAKQPTNNSSTEEPLHESAPHQSQNIKGQVESAVPSKKSESSASSTDVPLRVRVMRPSYDSVDDSISVFRLKPIPFYIGILFLCVAIFLATHMYLIGESKNSKKRLQGEAIGPSKVRSKAKTFGGERRQGISENINAGLPARLLVKTGSKLTEKPWGIGVHSTKGNVRSQNQDYALAYDVNGLQVLLVADGCGGVAYGAEASRIAVEFCSREILWQIVGQQSSIERAIQNGFLAASEALMDEGVKLKLETLEAGLRTTLIVAIGSEKEFHWGHIGDGALKVVRPNGEVKDCIIAHRSDAAISNVLSASLGPVLHGQPEFGCIRRRVGELLMAGTDGVFDRVDEGFAQDVVRMAIFQNGDLYLTAKDVLEQLAMKSDADGAYVCDDNLTLGILGDGKRPEFEKNFWKTKLLAVLE